MFKNICFIIENKKYIQITMHFTLYKIITDKSSIKILVL